MSSETFQAWKNMPETKEFFTHLAWEEHVHRMVVAEGTPLREDTNEKKMNSFLMNISS